MSKYTRKLFQNLLILFLIAFAAIINWYWPLYTWFGNSALYHFIWLGLFFVLFDLFIDFHHADGKLGRLQF